MIGYCIIRINKNSKYDFEKAVVLLNEAIDLNSKEKILKTYRKQQIIFGKLLYCRYKP